MLKIRFEFDDEEYLSDSRAYQVKQEDFRFNILYTDPSPLNYITEAKDAAGKPFPSNPTANNRVAETPLLKVFNLDKFITMTRKLVVMVLTFVQGITIDSQNGRLIFTTKEPFGNYYFLNYPIRVQQKIMMMPVLIMQTKEICFRNMYANTIGSTDSDKK
jgi:cell surface protein SprA